MSYFVKMCIEPALSFAITAGIFLEIYRFNCRTGSSSCTIGNGGSMISEMWCSACRIGFSSKYVRTPFSVIEPTISKPCMTGICDISNFFIVSKAILTVVSGATEWKILLLFLEITSFTFNSSSKNPRSRIQSSLKTFPT